MHIEQYISENYILYSAEEKSYRNESMVSMLTILGYESSFLSNYMLNTFFATIL